jgi:hypothetical protein
MINCIKAAGLAALVAAALVVLGGAGTASATVICKTNTNPCSEKYPAGTEIKASMTGSASMTTTEGTVLDTCSGGELTGKTANSGSAAETVRGLVPATNLTWSNCTNTVDTLAGGETETHAITGTVNGTYTASGFEVTVNTGLLGSCVFTAGQGTHIGTVTGGLSATVDVIAVITRKTGLCPSTAKWVTTYNVTSPTPLYVEPS